MIKNLRDFLWEKRAGIVLYFLTILTFVFVGCLYHIENIESLLYAVLITGFFWMAVGIFQMRHYFRRRRNLTVAINNPEQAAELLPQDEKLQFSDKRNAIYQGMGQLETDYIKLISSLEQRNLQLVTRAEERRTEQNDYYVMWTHQIKTPIAAMKLLTNDNFLLQEELFKIEQYVDMALHFQRLESMSSDIVLQKYDLYSMLKQCVKKYSILFINKDLSLQLEAMKEEIITDEKWFCFCVEQLLSNSIKYTAKGKVSVYMDRQQKDTLVIADTGIGIRSEDLPRIFERGFTGYNGRMDKKSTGIGLYLCKQILDRLGIEIRFESEEGVGTKVFMTVVKDPDRYLTKM